MRKLAVFAAVFACVLASAPAGCGRGGGAGDAVYYCPMHPSYTSPRPGDCPICNMKLVKMEKTPPGPAAAGESFHPAAGEDGGRAAASADRGKTPAEVCVEHRCTMRECAMMVRVGLKPGEKISCPVCGDYITTSSGTLVPAAPRTGPTLMISPEKQQLIGITTAPVRRRHLAKTVRASGKIAYDPGLFVTQEEFIQALNNEDALRNSPLSEARARAGSLADAARRKLALLGMSAEQIAALEKNRAPDRGLYLPGAGGRVWAYLAIYEYEIGLVKTGAPVGLSAVAYPGEKFHGTIASINPVLDPATRTNQVRVEVENPGGKLKPEMYVDAEIEVDLGEKTAVPASAVIDTGIRKIVYLSRGGGLLESREIRVGRRAGEYYEVADGLGEGDVVVTSGNFLVDSESRLKAAQEATGRRGSDPGPAAGGKP
jgi:hypothetical protein